MVRAYDPRFILTPILITRYHHSPFTAHHTGHGSLSLIIYRFTGTALHGARLQLLTKADSLLDDEVHVPMHTYMLMSCMFWCMYSVHAQRGRGYMHAHGTFSLQPLPVPSRSLYR